MASTLTGFRKNMETTIPEQVMEIRQRLTRLSEELEVCREDEAYLVAIAKVAGIRLDDLHEVMGAAVVADESHA